MPNVIIRMDTLAVPVKHGIYINYAKGTGSRGLQPSSSCMRGMVESGLTPGSRPDGRTPEILVLSGSRAGKLKMAQWFIIEFGAIKEQIRKNCLPAQMIHLRSVD